MIFLFLVPMALQAVAMFFDEIHYHRKRGLDRWERIGHPLDTLTVVACLAIASAAPTTHLWLIAYVALATVSCVFITKDEPIHAKQCSPGEHWLHSVLFILHPVVLAGVCMFWLRGLHALVVGQTALTLAFGVYQVAYWNLNWRHSWRTRLTAAR